jgi:xylulokinase
VDLLVGLDVGTSALKAIAVDARDGRVVATAAREYPLYTPAPGHAEQDGDDFSRAALEALADLAKQLGDARGEVRGIGLSGQMHSAMLLDAERRLVRRAILWCDTRTRAECEAITAALGHDGLRRTVRNLALEGFTLPKLLWVRAHEPAVYARIAHVVMPKDYVALALTGELGTDVSDASGTLAFDPAARAWSHEALRAVGVEARWFPQARESAEVVGGLTRAVAEATGLREGTPVVAGAADNAAAAVGLGVVRTGRGMVSIGTSGTVLAHTDALRVDAGMRLHSFCAAVPGASYLMGVMLSAGGALRWFRDTIAKRPYDAITADAARAERGAGGVVFLPYLMGERTPHNDANARGAFVGLSAVTGEAELSRAVLEGISYGLADSLALMRGAAPPVALDELRLTGGGARSAVWRQMLADVFGVEVAVTNSTEGAAFGAAVLAGVGAGVFGSVADAADALVRVVERTAPDPAASAYYREAHGTYCALYGDLRERFAAMAARPPRR